MLRVWNFSFYIFVSLTLITVCTSLFIHVDLYPLEVCFYWYVAFLTLGYTLICHRNIFHFLSGLCRIPSLIPLDGSFLLSHFAKNAPLKCCIFYYSVFGSKPGSLMRLESLFHSELSPWRTGNLAKSVIVSDNSQTRNGEMGDCAV